MKVYVVTASTYQDNHVQEVFVNEQDAKRYIADEKIKLEVDDREMIDYVNHPRTLRTGWRG